MDSFMEVAIEEAKKSLCDGGVPVGAVLVKNGKIIGKGHNKRIQKKNPVLHAELDCLSDAGILKDYSDTTLYSTSSPCCMCAGAVIYFGIKKVIVGESETLRSNSSRDARKFMESYGVSVIDLNLDACKQLLEEFINNNPQQWNVNV